MPTADALPPIAWPRFPAPHAEWRCNRPRPSVEVPAPFRQELEVLELARRRAVLDRAGRRRRRRRSRREPVPARRAAG